jgi:23S rRNA pseudouridine1911/1915/1917 synthase
MMKKRRKPTGPDSDKAAASQAHAAGAPPDALARSWCAVVGPGGASRADAYVADVSGILSRSQIKARGAVIRVNGVEAKCSRPLKEGDELEVLWTEEVASLELAEDIPLSILYEDDRVVVVDKAQGMVTHPGAGNRRGTLANALLFLAQREAACSGGQASGADSRAGVMDESRRAAPARAPARGPVRGGIVHRLDKDTSGVIIAAKDLEAQVFLAGQFKERLARKEYLAIVRGAALPASGRISDRLGRDRRDRKRFASVAEGGKVAITEYKVLACWSVASGGEASARGGASYTLVSLRPRTGRTHQLRVHMAGFGAPILGDPIYGRPDARFPEATLMLHAYRLRILLPGRSEASLFKAPVPRRFREMVRALDAAFGPAVRLSS